jgi:hypothetical protein
MPWLNERNLVVKFERAISVISSLALIFPSLRLLCDETIALLHVIHVLPDRQN